MLFSKKDPQISVLSVFWYLQISVLSMLIKPVSKTPTTWSSSQDYNTSRPRRSEQEKHSLEYFSQPQLTVIENHASQLQHHSFV